MKVNVMKFLKIRKTQEIYQLIVVIKICTGVTV